MSKTKSKTKSKSASKLPGDDHEFYSGLINMLDHAKQKILGGEIDEGKRLAGLAAARTDGWAAKYVTIPLTVPGLEIVVRRGAMEQRPDFDEILQGLIKEANYALALEAPGNDADKCRLYVNRIADERATAGDAETLKTILTHLVEFLTNNDTDKHKVAISYLTEMAADVEADRMLAAALPFREK